MIQDEIILPEDEYRTVEGPTCHEIKVRGSRFIATVDYADTPNAAEDFIATIARKYHDATHNCFAYRVGIGNKIIERYSDHGEPSGTAGIPIMNSIKSQHLTNMVLVVTRYFGGTKLGTGNLARAYAQSASEVLIQAKLVTKILTGRVQFTAPIQSVSAIYHQVNVFKAKMLNEIYGAEGNFTVLLRLSAIELFKTALVEATNGKVEFIDFQERNDA